MDNSSLSKRDSKSEPDLHDEPSSIPPVDEKALLRKLDWRLVPWFSFLYLLSFLDRSSIGNARLYNMEKDLHITDKQYLLALTVFYFSYACLEIPSNLLLKRLKPSLWLSFLILMWGICMTVQGLVHNYGGLVTMRFLLGFFEAGLFPGVAYYFSCWYKRSQLGLRFAVFFSAATVSGAFGGLLAAAISKMEGVGGKHAWAWIFILEGLATIIASLSSFWVIQDFPETATFLSEPERAYLLHELRKDRQQSAQVESFKAKYVWQALSDRKVWAAMFIFAGLDGSLFAFSLFIPSIINKASVDAIEPADHSVYAIQLGFHANIANLLSVPVYVWACILTCVVGFIGDKYKNIRGYLNLLFFGIGMAGYIILIASRTPALSYFAVYMAACGIYPTTPNSIAWVSANTEGSLKRSVVLALCIGFGTINGAVTSNVYRAPDAPWYTLGHAIVLAYISIGFFGSLTYRLLCRQENMRRDSGDRDEVIAGSDEKQGDIRNGTFDSHEEALREKGDAWSRFRYVL